MKQCCAAIFVLLGAVPFTAHVFGHGLPIDVYANAETGRLFVFENFESGELELFPGIDISTDAPGIGVNFPTNGIASGSTLGLDVTQGLMFWDGTQLLTPTVSLWLDNPAQTESYTVSANSGEQAGMTWATYPGGSFWDAHGLFSLDSLSAPIGIYGVAIRITSPSYEPTKPFLLPLIYDHNLQMTTQQLNDGLEALREAVEVPASGDFNGDGRVDGLDFLIWQKNYDPNKSFSVTHADGDADLDSDIDSVDMAFWAEQYGSISTSVIQVIPEPATSALAWFSTALLCIGARRWTR